MTNAGLKISPSVAAVLILTAPAFAATLHVPDDFLTIQGCIDAASAGDECVVAPGTYNECINFKGMPITLRSSDGPDVTIIDGTGFGCSVVRCVSEEGPDTVLDGLTITGGEATWGGGMYNEDSSPTVSNCVFTGNSAIDGGGMANFSFLVSSSPKVIDCRFLGNTAQQQGGGMNNNGPDGAPTSDPSVVNCVFHGNTATRGGGGMFNNNGASPAVTNCTFSGNSGGPVGGGMVNGFSSPGQVLVTNCTFSGNSAGISGAGMHNGYVAGIPSQVLVTNCVFWNNSPDQITGGEGGETLVSYSDVEGGWGGAGGTGNINVAPLFVDADGDDNVQGTEDDNLRLSPGSPCIDAGDNNAVPPGITVDLDGNSRFVNDPNTPDTGNPGPQGPPVVDMGAYEFQIPIITVVIDIKPGSDPNSINLGSHGVVPVAILTTGEFDATTVDPDTINLAGASIALRGNGRRLLASYEDVDDDGDDDLMLHIETENLQLETGATEAILTGKTFDGQDISGMDTIVIVNE
ncbi:MAG: hypothetical protein IH987_08875 [Planctomycetes bacterium]|nr:hypothetical protein [Planctomycetota bacterium]